MSVSITPVILSGGSGTRLWPLSRTKLPKQFCEIFADSLQNLCLQRALKLGQPCILTSVSLKDLTEAQLRKVGVKDALRLYEPMAQNTAPAIAFLCQYFALKNQSEQIVAVLPADQLIEDDAKFVQSIHLAAQEAQNGKVVTLGIQPNAPATGFGYIQTDKSVQGLIQPVLAFHEKPQLEKAKEFIQKGNFYWNAGIFVFKISKMIELFKKHQPQIWKTAQSIKADLSNLKEVYEQFENISIDYAVMEKLSSQELSCVPADLGWSDVGSWDAVADILRQGDRKNSAIEVHSNNNFLYPQAKKSYAFVGVEDLILVDTPDALLLVKKGASQDVKSVVDELKKIRPQVLAEHNFEDRSWGRYEILKDENHFKTKVLHIKPNSQISYQSHSKREEHWLVAKGHGEVILNDKVIPVEPGSYVKIPVGAKHRIRNTGTEGIEIFELQVGSYFGEDDIVRYEDDYQRV